MRMFFFFSFWYSYILGGYVLKMDILFSEWIVDVESCIYKACVSLSNKVKIMCAVVLGQYDRPAMGHRSNDYYTCMEES
jgi:hypothetical protein